MEKEKKIELFDIGSICANNLGLYTDNLYLCPLCRNTFTKQDIESGNLTAEHVPQNRIGGKELVLTCKDCNTKRFSAIDNELVQYFKVNNIYNALKGKQVVERQTVKLEIDGTEINAYLRIDSNGIETFIDTDHNHQPFLDKFEVLLKQENAKIKVKPNISYKKRLSQIAELKNAYLFVFAQFGYSYILQKKHRFIFDQLLNPDKIIIDGFYFDKTDGESEIRGIMLIEEPYKMVFIFMEKCKIALPWFEDAQLFYDKLNRHFKSNNELRCKTIDFINLPSEMKMIFDKKNA